MTNPNQSNVQQSNLIDRLRTRIRKVETASRVDDGVRVSSGCAAIDRLLPDGGYQRGMLVQWLTSGGHGADYLSLLLAREACADGGALVVFDPLNQFYPPAAAAIGINLDNLVILRTQQSATQQQVLPNDLLWSIDQSLRCPAVAAVWGPLDHIDERWFRRFQLSAESSGCLGLFIQPVHEARQPSWAEVQWLVSHVSRSQFDPRESLPHRPNPDADPSRSQLVRLHLTRCWGTQTGKTLNLSINTITGNVHPARRDHEQHFSTAGSAGAPRPATPPGKRPPAGPMVAPSKPNVTAQNPLSVVSQLAHPATGRQRA